MDISSTLILVLVGLLLIGGLSGLVGTYTFLRKSTLVGDAVSHSVLPGVAIGFMFSGTKDPLFLLLGGCVFGYISIRCIELIVAKSKLSMDTAIALVSSVFFALGAVFLSYISGQENGQQAGLQDFLFGKAATMTEGDVQVFFYSGIAVLVCVILFFKPFMLLSFNEDFAAAQGWKTKRYLHLLSLLTVVVITIGLQAVGVVLMSAMLIAPAASARYWTDSLKKMMVLAGVLGAIAGVGGGLLSLLGENMPTGPWVIMILFLITFVTLLISPKKGYLALQSKARENQRLMSQENLLKVLYGLHENGVENPEIKRILDTRRMDSDHLQYAIKTLVKNDWAILEKGRKCLQLSDSGTIEAKRVVRLHRLWELYLTSKMNFKEDHIHGTAETIEHLLTEELEEALLKELGYPDLDPHDKEIPYS
jgi:manganese/zinc/iron transport system permease protein